MKKVFIFFAIIACIGWLSKTSCYKTPQKAWEACDKKYNGKCKFLGNDFKVCK
ncbi:hypothetical protein [Vibrio splendidus]|uniref:hypothetical protein n=1 Tax=Vibrio splendidus TaxID=29497 RepID=UPI0013000EC9|nr:hypothetical protein [Vibrio splendidus]